MTAALHVATHSGYYRFEKHGADWRQAQRALTFWSLTCVAGEEEDPQTLYVGTERSGVFISRDGGDSWARPNPNIPQLSTTALLSQDGDLLVGTVPAALYRRRAEAWTEIEALRLGTAGSTFPPNPDLGSRTRYLAGDPHLPGFVYAGIEVGGILVSSDGGSSWEPANQGLSDPDVHEVCPSAHTPALVFAACGEEGVFRSTNRGASWQRVTPDGPRAYGTAVTEDRTGQVYLGMTRGRPNTWVRDERADGAVYCSKDAGQHWTLVLEHLAGGVLDFCTRPDADGVIASTSEGDLIEITADGQRTFASGLPCITELIATP